MSPPFSTSFKPILAAVALLYCSCTSTVPGPATRKEQGQVLPLCLPRANAVQQEVRGLLMGALESGGTAAAFQACSRQAPALLLEAGKAEPRLDMRRVSRRPLGANQPDVWEALALEHFEQQLALDRALPQAWVQRLEADGQRRFRCYLPITMGSPCLPCHGGAESLADTVKALLVAAKVEAPAYAQGELLGLLRVEIAAGDLP